MMRKQRFSVRATRIELEPRPIRRNNDPLTAVLLS